MSCIHKTGLVIACPRDCSLRTAQKSLITRWRIWRAWWKTWTQSRPLPVTTTAGPATTSTSARTSASHPPPYNICDSVSETFLWNSDLAGVMQPSFTPSTVGAEFQDDAEKIQNAPWSNAEEALKMQNVNSKDKNVQNFRLNTRFCCKQICFQALWCWFATHKKIPRDSRCCRKILHGIFVCIFKSFLHKSFISLPMQK